jgi:exodeoxyribonuclease V alpha subunit
VLTSADGERFPLANRVALLQHTYRFTAASGIGQVSRLVTAGEGAAALEILAGDECTDIHWQPLPAGRQLEAALDGLVAAGYGGYLQTDDPAEALRRYDRFRLLAAVRVGEFGVTGLNMLTERILARHRLIDPRPVWYAGRPVLVTVNDYGVRLFNGDIGLTLPDPAHDNELRVFFTTLDGQVRSVHPLRLPAHETAFALTVHKSQGSEFTKVALVLPPDDLPLLTRELIYTGLSRARETAHLFAAAEVFQRAVNRQVTRSSGLRERLWPT